MSEVTLTETSLTGSEVLGRQARANIPLDYFVNNVLKVKRGTSEDVSYKVNK